MFCSNCGTRIEGLPKFCPECGSKLNVVEEIKDEVEKDIPKNSQQKESIKSDEDLVEKIKKINPLIIAAAILLFISFFIDYFVIVKSVTFIVSLMGYSQIKKGKGEGKTLAIIFMLVAGVLGFISIIKIIQYAQYSAASYGAMDGVLSWFEDLVY